MAAHDIQALAARIAEVPFSGRRRLVAINGAPASGKSTISDKLQALIPNSAVVPMDGFHLDNDILDARDLRSRKGSPPSFDVDGFVSLIKDLGAQGHVSYPLFDREQDRAIPDAGQLDADVETVLVEGNYLLLRSGGWEVLQPLWDFTIYLDVPLDELERRLLHRWRSLGLPEDEVTAKTYGNDLPNAKTVAENSFPADTVI